MSKIVWEPAKWQVVVSTKDYVVQFVGELQFDTPIKGQPGFALIYGPTGHRQAEGADIVAAVAQCYAAQRLLDSVKKNPSLITQDPGEQSLEGFFGEPEGKAN